MVLLLSFGGPAFAIVHSLEHIYFQTRIWDCNGDSSWWLPDPCSDTGWFCNEFWVFLPNDCFKGV